MPSVAAAALRCRCPRCGDGQLFEGVLAIRTSCPACGLDFAGFDTGDGFAVPILMVLGALIVGAAFWVDFHLHPPFWVHAVLWPPIAGALAVLMTRYIKSFLAAQQFATRRSEMKG